MTAPSPAQTAYRDIIIAVHDWQTEAKAREMEFYSYALTHNELHVIQGKEITTRKAKCDCCYYPQQPGIKKFRYREDNKTSIHSWWVYLCEHCWSEMVDNVSLDKLVVAQKQESVLTTT